MAQDGDLDRVRVRPQTTTEHAEQTPDHHQRHRTDNDGRQPAMTTSEHVTPLVREMTPHTALVFMIGHIVGTRAERGVRGRPRRLGRDTGPAGTRSAPPRRRPTPRCSRLRSAAPKETDHAAGAAEQVLRRPARGDRSVAMMHQTDVDGAA
jgi:hypothetical protein